MSKNLMGNIVLEICVDSIESAINAAEGGADRLELCSALSEGGLTPTSSLLKVVKQNVNIPVFCMIQPRRGLMTYSEKEKQIILLEAKELKGAGADGLVFGALTLEGKIDQLFCKQFMEVADGLPCTFHRAFDLTVNPLKELQVLIDIGFHRVLTSGTKRSAMEGAALIKELNDIANERIIVLAGAGVRATNCVELITLTGVKEIHSSTKTKKLIPQSRFHDAQMGDDDEDILYVASTSEVQLIKSELGKIKLRKA